MTETTGEICEQLFREAWAAAQRGEIELSLELCNKALEQAQISGDQLLEDRAQLNRAAVLVDLGQGASARESLSRILMKYRNSDPGFAAAYTLARICDGEGDAAKALFYARIANERARENGRPEQLASSHNQLGDFLLAASDFDSALEQFELALENLPCADRLRQAVVLDNRGYCHVVCGRLELGFTDLFRSLRICMQLKARRHEASVRLSLSFAYLQCDRHSAALRHARRSFQIAEEIHVPALLKHGLFLLGEAEKLAGNPLAARYYFVRLQKEFYPAAGSASDLLLLLNVRSLVNLKA